MRENSIIFFVIVCGSLVFLGNSFNLNHSSGQSETDPIAKVWIDFTSIITDVSVFIIVGFMGYIATRINSWIKGNKEWKDSIQKRFDEHGNKIDKLTAETKNEISKTNTAIQLLIQNSKSTKEINDREISEIAHDYDALSLQTTENKVRIQGLEEDVKELRQDLKYKNK